MTDLIEIGVLVLAGFFFVRFVVDFFVDKAEKESDELRILKAIAKTLGVSEDEYSNKRH